MSKPYDEWCSKLNMEDVPIGHVLDPRIEPSPEETQAFKDWTCPINAPPVWKRPSFWRTTTEDTDERRVLEYWLKGDQALVTGDLDWRDARVEASVRQLIAASSPGPDDEYAHTARSGVMVRMWTVRHYYYLCLEGLSRVVLYRRENNLYTPLAARETTIDPDRYYSLRLEALGNRLRGHCDDELIADIFDTAHTHGRVGIRTNTLSRFEQLTARLTPREVKLLSASRAREAAHLEEIRAQYPKPVLWRQIEIQKHRAGSILSIGRYGSGVDKDLLLNSSTPDGKPALTAITLDGEEIWMHELVGGLSNVKSHDMIGSGTDTIAGFRDKHIVLIDGTTGVEKACRPFPKTSPFQGKPGDIAMLDALYIAHLRPGARPRDIVVKECDPGGGHICWCYDEELNLRWTTTVDQPRHGHHFGFYDFDRDGLEEICAGYHLIGPDGQIRWRIEGGQSFEVFQYGRHADSCAGGDFDGDGRGEVAIVGGSEGFFLCDGETGDIIAKHHIGHAQGLSVASFRKDLPGMEIHAGTRWGNYGIRAFYSGEGSHLFTFQPDFMGQQGTPVNWRGDGEELLLIASSPEAHGLWNASGQKVVLLPEGNPLVVDVTGDARDELLIVRDGGLYIYTQDTPPADPNRVYAPIRHRRLGNPVVSYPNWEVKK